MNTTKRTLSPEHRKALSIALKGNKNGLGHKKSIAVRKQISNMRILRFKRLGYLNSPETRKKISQSLVGGIPWNKGKKMPPSMGKKMSIITSMRLANPKNHYNWKGGKSFEPYPSVFTKQLKLKIRTRDKFTCQKCGVKEKDYFQKLSVNHIDYNKVDCSENNLITLCRSCNAKVNFNRKYWARFFKEKVQRL